MAKKVNFNAIGIFSMVKIDWFLILLFFSFKNVIQNCKHYEWRPHDLRISKNKPGTKLVLETHVQLVLLQTNLSLSSLSRYHQKEEKKKEESWDGIMLYGSDKDTFYNVWKNSNILWLPIDKLWWMCGGGRKVAKQNTQLLPTN